MQRLSIVSYGGSLAVLIMLLTPLKTDYEAVIMWLDDYHYS